MADTTPRLAFPLLAAGQAQKEVFHNEALLVLDLLVQATAETLGDTVPPTAPLAGQAWIVGANPSGAWAGQPGTIAGWTDGGWRFVLPAEGMRLWIRTLGQFADFRSGAWVVGQLTAASLRVEGIQVVSGQQPAIANPAGGSTVDQVARSALISLLDGLRSHGLIAR